MCIFSGAVESVSQTSIFARLASEKTQYLAYQMQYQSSREVAMVLPLPVSSRDEAALRFISLERYPRFFEDLRRGFPRPSKGRSPTLSEPTDDAKLAVHQVGSYEASFVPRLADFQRLDSRFRLPPRAWEQLPGYANYGFAVFKLQSGSRRVHPMALEFPTSKPNRLFFPTVHIHDGQVHRHAEFDHALYCQLPNNWPRLRTWFRGWTESAQPAGVFMKTSLAASLLDSEEHCHQRILKGRLRNEDTWA